ncbi:MAG: peptide chain release factor 1 [Meiothermus sp.]|uniref:peptide chain release factor 1 n=1 Tax=Meiothermus sp. TaxID=1955249 RepID=UPI0025F9FB25|nr:peptide chain release factor 1 [Meiothermus sp.]MCS7058845.1 peptide chain release factor 1 [Meiothermus sp.]MCS7194554.1 peptide chain release factor 1 [Meiothermus sp.]MCX7740344.1 peptide chain release factor 1 [Meiothermus sp.]MDW8091810.1 peptide chain release factor 1 [Meiothermus sp.]MDW8482078.1 peptide chain release factor 1 [Meiothermus sp.]
MLEKLEPLEKEYQTLEQQLADPAVLSNPSAYQRITKRYAEMGHLIRTIRAYKQALAQREEARELLSDPELGEMARADLQELEVRIRALEAELELLLLPKDPLDEKNAIVEVRAGTGGEEAALFAAELRDMIMEYARRGGYRVEVLDTSLTDLGGVSKVVFGVNGPGAYGYLKYEAGVHRVQRVPATETQGRIHTSTATVAVMPEAEEVDVEIDPADLEITVSRASGPGGQGVNTTDSAVQILHKPTGLIVSCMESRSQIKNKERALSILRTRLLEMRRAEEAAKRRESRLAQIGAGERSEKIRTYNFPQSRVTDHRIGFTTHDLEGVLSGDLSKLHEALRKADQERQLEALSQAAASQSA